ncbi:MAG: hypothetical protein JO323_05375 [Acidobacteriia bacterium]|nr:hypothetical protein [Terriglobia bacterium]
MVNQNMETAKEDAVEALMGIRRMDGIPHIRNDDGTTNHAVENQALAEEKKLVEEKLSTVTQKYNLTEREQEEYLFKIALDARIQINNRYGDPHQGVDNEKEFLERMEKSPTRAARAKRDEESSKMSELIGLNLTRDPELLGESKKPNVEKAAEAHSREKTLEAALRKENLYDAEGRFLRNGQEDGVLGKVAAVALEKFEKAHGLQGNASDIAAIDSLVASGKIDAKFGDALKSITADGTLAKLETKFGSATNLPEDHLASSDKIQKSQVTGTGRLV